MASLDLGDLGASEGEPLVYSWPLTRNIPWLLPWLFMLAFLFLPSNYSLRAYAAIAVAAGLFAAGSLMHLVPFFRQIGFEEILVLYQHMAMGLCVLWLVSHSARGRNRALVFLLAAVALALACFMIIASDEAFKLGDVGRISAIVASLESLAIIGAMALGGISCRKKYTPLRFALWNALWLPVANTLCVLGVAVIVLLTGGGAPSLREMVFGVAMIVLVTTIGSVAILLPFLVLTFKNRLYRERFYAIFRLPGMVEQSAGSAVVPESAAK